MELEFRLRNEEGTVQISVPVTIPNEADIASLQFRQNGRPVFSVPLFSHDGTPMHTICQADGSVTETGPQ